MSKQRYVHGRESGVPPRPPSAAEINRRNRKAARYRGRLAERVLGTSAPIEITPEMERALNTPVNELPVDQSVLGALRRASTRNGDMLAHLRLAKMRSATRAAQRARNAARPRKASDAKQALAAARREAVKEAAAKLLKTNPRLSRAGLARRIYSDPRYEGLKIGEDRIETILKQERIPPSKRPGHIVTK